MHVFIAAMLLWLLGTPAGATPPRAPVADKLVDSASGTASETVTAKARGKAAKGAPARKAPPRRAVYQVIDTMPAAATSVPLPTVGPSYGPRLGPMPALPAPVTMPPGSVLTPVAPGPAVIGRCDAGGCNDTGGARYNGASGTLLNSQGRPCTTIAGVVSC